MNQWGTLKEKRKKEKRNKERKKERKKEDNCYFLDIQNVYYNFICKINYRLVNIIISAYLCIYVCIFSSVNKKRPETEAYTSPLSFGCVQDVLNYKVHLYSRYKFSELL